MATQVALAATAGHKRYIARGKNQLHTIFENHFSEFCDQYDERFAQKYGRFRLRRIESVAERFGTCGDYRHGVARIRCTNPECGHDHFRPFSCKLTIQFASSIEVCSDLWLNTSRALRSR